MASLTSLPLMVIVVCGAVTPACSGAAPGAEHVGRSITASGGSMGASSEGGATSDFALEITAHLLATAEGSASEAAPAGVPSHWSWVAAATATNTSPPDGVHTHANYWGAVFRGPSNATPANTHVELRNCSMWFLHEEADRWIKTNSSAELGGSTFTPSYSGGGPEPRLLEVRPMGSDVVPADGHIWHFWQGNGYQLVSSGVREVISNCQSRLAARSPAAEEDRAAADYLVHMGADWRNPSDPACVDDNYICPSWGVSRLERVTAAWRNHTFHSLTQADVSAGVPLPPATLFVLPAD